MWNTDRNLRLQVPQLNKGWCWYFANFQWVKHGSSGAQRCLSHVRPSLCVQRPESHAGSVHEDAHHTLFVAGVWLSQSLRCVQLLKGSGWCLQCVLVLPHLPGKQPHLSQAAAPHSLLLGLLSPASVCQLCSYYTCIFPLQHVLPHPFTHLPLQAPFLSTQHASGGWLSTNLSEA